jgi:hypothetical protein
MKALNPDSTGTPRTFDDTTFGLTFNQFLITCKRLLYHAEANNAVRI